MLFPAGYVEVKTPIIFNKGLWETSGHWSHYRENMFLVESRDGEEMGLKAMNCPGHMLVFGSEMRSYKDLPLRFHEQTPLHRNEASGVLSGLTRVRQFSQDDAHCFVTDEQIGVGSRGADQAGAARLRRLRPRVHGQAVDAAREVPRRGRDLGPRRGRRCGRRWSAPRRPTRSTRATARSTARRSTSTSPTRSAANGSAARFSSTTSCPQRFDLKYIGADNTEHRPVVIHRAIFGSFERFIAILIEHFAGAFPLWMAPVQVTVLPIADRHGDYAREVLAALRRPGSGP